MANPRVVRRYATALFQAAQRGEAVERVEQDLEFVEKMLDSVPALGRVLRAPTIANARKKELVERTLSGALSPLVQRFISLLIDRNREDVLFTLRPVFMELAYAARNIQPVTVTTARPLEADTLDSLRSVLEARLSRTVALTVKEDPALIGGIMVRVGDTVIDGSVRHYLRQLHAQLLDALSLGQSVVFAPGQGYEADVSLVGDGGRP